MAHCSAACTNGRKEIAIVGRQSKKIGIDMFPFNKDEMILPISSSVKTVIPYRSKILSSLNGRSTLNSTFSLNSQREICLAKPAAKVDIHHQQKTVGTAS